MEIRNYYMTLKSAGRYNTKGTVWVISPRVFWWNKHYIQSLYKLEMSPLYQHKLTQKKGHSHKSHTPYHCLLYPRKTTQA